jgi:hypothetical protein
VTTPRRQSADLDPASRAGRGGPVALWSVALAACAVCCAGPLLAVLAAVGVTASVAARAVPALAVVALAAFASVYWVRRRAQARCAVPATPLGPVEVTAPTLRQSDSTDDAPVSS